MRPKRGPGMSPSVSLAVPWSACLPLGLGPLPVVTAESRWLGVPTSNGPNRHLALSVRSPVRRRLSLALLTRPVAQAPGDGPGPAHPAVIRALLGTPGTRVQSYRGRWNTLNAQD